MKNTCVTLRQALIKELRHALWLNAVVFIFGLMERSVTMKNFSVFVLSLVLIFLAGCQTNTMDSASPDAKTKPAQSVSSVNPPLPLKGLSGVGIHTMAFWSGAVSVDPSDLSRFKKLETYGLTHVNVGACADWIINISCRRATQTKENTIQFVRNLLNQTDLHVVLQLKAYKQEKIRGKNTSELQTRLEKDEVVQQNFTVAWRSLAKSFRDIPRERLSFNLLNEPEFEQPKVSNSKRKKWENIASQTIQAIREVSPDRVIIVEGIGKSLFSSKDSSGAFDYWSPSDLIKPLPYDDLVYGFHSYEPERFLQQKVDRAGRSGIKYSASVRRSVARDAKRLINWANKYSVPVIISETGCIGYVDGVTEGPAEPDDCGQYANDVYELYVLNGIPVTWWALEKEKTIYVKEGSEVFSSYPSQEIPDPHIFEGLRLTIPDPSKLLGIEEVRLKNRKMLNLSTDQGKRNEACKDPVFAKMMGASCD